MNNKNTFAFFGSSSFSIHALNSLEENGFLPKVIVTLPDKPKGRELKISPSDVKVWAMQKNIPTLEPEKLSDSEFKEKLKNFNCQVFIVASYGKIIPEEIINLPKFKTLNIHPSLLPLYRGASPIQSMILNDEKNVGISIMEIDKEMDHGPIVKQQNIMLASWPMYEKDAEKLLAEEGGKMLAEVLPLWLGNKIEKKEQDHTKATYTKKFSKQDGLIDLNSNPKENYLKILAFHRSPKAYFFDNYKDKQIRVIVTRVRFEDGKLIIEKVIPEGKKEMSYEAYLNGRK